MTTHLRLLHWLHRRSRMALVHSVVALTVAALLLPIGPAVPQLPGMGSSVPNPLIDPPDID